MTIDIYAADEQHDQPIELETWVALANASLSDEGVRGLAEVSLIFLDESTIAALNQQFMGKKDRPTSSVSPSTTSPNHRAGCPTPGAADRASRPLPEIPQLIGDIVICPAVAALNAVEHEVSFNDEIALLVVHGVLHLLGWTTWRTRKRSGWRPASVSCWRATTRRVRRDRRFVDDERHLSRRHGRGPVGPVRFLRRRRDVTGSNEQSRARSLRDQGRHGAKALVELSESPEKFLNTILLLVLICQLVSATMVGVLAGRLFGAAGLFIATVGEVVVIFVIFEAIPKNYAVQHPDSAALTAAPVVRRILKFWPIKWVSNFLLSIADTVIGWFGPTGRTSRVTESEVLAMADVAHEDRAIESDERNFIHSVIEFGDTIVREVMVPRIDMVDIADTATIRQALDLAVESGRSRLPVLGEGVDDVVGIVNLRHLAGLVANGNGDEVLSEHMGQPNFVPETKRVASLLSEIRRSKSHLYIVVDEYGGTQRDS